MKGSGELDAGSESVAKLSGEERTYPVRLRDGVFLYFANRMAPIYTEELNKRRQEGSFQSIEDFKKSQFGRLMTSVLDKFDENQKVPNYVVLDMAESDLELILDKVRAPDSFEARVTYRLMRDELVDGFKNTRLKQAANRLAGKIFRKAIDTDK